MPHGICPVLETPFHADQSVDEAGFGRVIDAMTAAGVESVMFPGFASEFHTLTDAERRRLTDILLDHSAQGGPAAVISVPDHATATAVANAEYAAANGAAAINLLPPHFLAPPPDEVLAHLRAVLDAVAPLPVVLQYAPAQTGTALDARSIKQLAAEHPNLACVKVESQPPGRLIAALAARPQPLPSLVGYAGLQLPDALRRGAVGVQPGCSFVEIYLEIWHRWTTGDQQRAEALHQRLAPYLAYWMQHVNLIVAAEKTVSVARGWFASDTCRRPGWRLDAEERAMIDRFLDEFADHLLPGPRPGGAAQAEATERLGQNA
ncbi:dihydrodipicolinate synthase family protein [Streptacidiphilus sp. MAP5-3]|uniref:dihydrodipicolinate synthase family protein n=1 Tax=unclassified Streptacidiphilus TaxID=2643834 RepID=UPI00351661BD